MADDKHVTFDSVAPTRGADEPSMTVSKLKNIIPPEVATPAESDDNIRVSKLTNIMTPQPAQPNQRRRSSFDKHHPNVFEQMGEYVKERAKSFHPHDVATAKQLLKK